MQSKCEKGMLRLYLPLSTTKRVLLLSWILRSFRGIFLLSRLRARSRPCPDTFLLTSMSSKCTVIIFKSFLVSTQDKTASDRLEEGPFET